MSFVQAGPRGGATRLPGAVNPNVARGGLFSIGATLRSTVRLAEIAAEISGENQLAIAEAERAGLAVLDEETPQGATLRLHSSIESGENQSAVWFRIAGIIGGRPYGYAQEYGWHDRGGGWHEGNFMLAHAAEAAAQAYLLWMGQGGVTVLDPVDERGRARARAFPTPNIGQVREARP